MRVLMVAEKPSIAQSIAKVLAKGGFSTSKGRATPIHEWQGQFRGQTCTFLMTSVLGHVYTLDFPQNLPRDVDPRDLFAAPTEKKEANPNQHLCQHLQQVAKGCHVLILWLDCDREGENIGFEVIENCTPKMVHNHQIFRARFSAITHQDVMKAMNSLVKPNLNESLSIDARREIDLKVGVAFTRYQTATFHFRYANLDANLISYGPCQTPTLGFCVDRYDEIQHFKPQPYYKLVAHISRNGIKTKLKWQRGRIMKDRSIVLQYLTKMNTDQNISDQESTNSQPKLSSGWAKCIDVKNSRSKFVRPVPLNTVALMKTASSMLGMGPQQCMNIAEHLYIRGYISYPRTESSAYPQHFDIRQALEEHANHPQWGNVVTSLLKNGIKKAKKGVDHGDHPPITPMASAQRDVDLSGSEWRLYEYITCHFIATVCPDAIIENQTILYDIGGEIFTSSGSTMVEQGFIEVMPWAKPADKYMAAVRVGDLSPVESVDIKEGKTKPPGFITETELISLMEKHGIGTDASIPTHIQNIQRNYVRLHERTRTLEPNKLGIALVHGYHRIDPELVLPKVRANIENLVSKIATGQATYDEVLKSSLATFLQKYDNFIENIAKMDELFHASFSSLGDVQVNTKLKPKCGKCDRYMKYIDTKPHRFYCIICEEVYSLPRDGSLKSLSPPSTCPIDGFEVVVYTDRKGKGVKLCPCCYNSPNYPGMKVNSTCAGCPNVGCDSNMIHQQILENCIHCDIGYMYMEPNVGRRINCTMCNYHIELPNDANQISINHKTKCEKCGMKKLNFKYSEKNTPQSDKSKLEFIACVKCDPVISPLCTAKGIPGMKSLKPGKFARNAQKPSITSNTSNTTQPTSKPSQSNETQFYNLAAIAAITGGSKTYQEPVAETPGGYNDGPRKGRRGRGRNEPEAPAPPPKAANIMDMALVQKKPAKVRNEAISDWPDYNPADFEPTKTINPAQAPSQYSNNSMQKQQSNSGTHQLSDTRNQKNPRQNHEKFQERQPNKSDKQKHQNAAQEPYSPKHAQSENPNTSDHKNNQLAQASTAGSKQKQFPGKPPRGPQQTKSPGLNQPSNSVAQPEKPTTSEFHATDKPKKQPQSHKPKDSQPSAQSSSGTTNAPVVQPRATNQPQHKETTQGKSNNAPKNNPAKQPHQSAPVYKPKDSVPSQTGAYKPKDSQPSAQSSSGTTDAPMTQNQSTKPSEQHKGPVPSSSNQSVKGNSAKHPPAAKKAHSNQPKSTPKYAPKQPEKTNQP